MSGSVDASFGVKLKEDLVRLGYDIVQPCFTTKKDITLSSWCNKMDEIKSLIGEKDIFICHSLACLFIIKYCVSNNISDKLIISIAGGLCREDEVFEGFGHLIPFIPSVTELENWSKLNNTIYNIYSDNDHIYNMTQLERYTIATGATPIFIPNKGHFGASAGVTDIPEIVDIIISNDSE